MSDQGWAHPELLCDTDWLADHLDHPDVVVVDCDQPPLHRRLVRALLPQKRCLPHSVWRGDTKRWRPEDADGISRTIRDLATFEHLMGGLGIARETRVVCYGGAGGPWAAWIWCALTRFGHTNCQVLHGGADKWRAEGRVLSRVHRQPDPTTYTATSYDHSSICLLDDVAATINQAGHVFWDLRCDDEWCGKTAMGTKRGGHIPGAVHLDWRETLVRPLCTLKPPNELRQMLERVGITPDKVVTTYCHGGIRAAHGFFLLRLLGYERIRIYDASWLEYGNALALPVEPATADKENCS